MKRALDLFCGAGGASMGIHLAGYEVTGVDQVAQPEYPFEFIQADAMEIALNEYDFIWASPPVKHIHGLLKVGEIQVKNTLI